MECISYKKGYKYQLTTDYATTMSIKPDSDIITDYIELSSKGQLMIKKAYAWNGPSGPTFDSLNFMRGSLVHDALYQLMRAVELDSEQFRMPVDKLLQKMCKEDGMSSLRAWWVYQGVRLAGEPAADPVNKKSAIRAPATCQ